MNHDINHCNGEGCPCKETCLSYKAHLDLLKPSNSNEPFRGWASYTDSNVCIENDLFMYCEEKSEHSGDIHDETDVISTRE